MKIEDLVLISLDDHIIEPADMFEKHLPAQYKASGPKLHHDESGADYWIFEDMRVGGVGLNAVVGRPKQEYGCEPLSHADLRPGCYQVDARIDDMNANGILASLNFPTAVKFDGQVFNNFKDKTKALVYLRAYNDWYIDQWCGAHPGRSIPLALIPYWDVAASIEEIKRVSKKGCHAVNFNDNPTAVGLPSIHNGIWDPLWKACAEYEMVLCMHHGTGNRALHASEETPINGWITLMPMSISLALVDWLHHRALLQYPQLKIALIESGIGWIPFVVERAGFVQQQHGQWTNSDFGGKHPFDLYREHFLATFVDDHAGLELIDMLGAHTICFESDYPHSDCQWPNSPEVLHASLGKLTDEQIDLITHRNAMRAFHFDPFTSLGGRQNCTVGALRAKAKHVDTSEVSRGGARPLGEGEKPRVLTSKDVISMFERANQLGSDKQKLAGAGSY